MQLKGAHAMHPSTVFIATAASVLLGACACHSDASTSRMFGRNARIREISGEVIDTGASWWGARYIVVKDHITGLRVFVLSDAAACVPGKRFRGTGHLTHADEKDYDATFHFHLMNGDKACD
jgi:hypothetical protein